MSVTVIVLLCEGYPERTYSRCFYSFSSVEIKHANSEPIESSASAK